jgi:hypothetical protein
MTTNRGKSIPGIEERAAVQAVAYSDIFDYPLTAAELRRYLSGTPIAQADFECLLRHGPLVPEHLSEIDGYYTLPGRESIVETRRQREANAARLWPRALHYGRLIAGLPFVRMVAVTGELAVNNVQPGSDIDYFIVTEPGRVWLARAMAIGVVHYAAKRGDIVCPNYLVSELALALDDRNLYTAHELAQMVPISGFVTYRRLRELNGWVADFLPNAAGPPAVGYAAVRAERSRAAGERALRTRAGARLERWEMERKIRKLTREHGVQAEASFTAQWCKGHVGGHESRILARFDERRLAVERQMP